MQALPPPSRRAVTPSPVVPPAHVALAALPAALPPQGGSAPGEETTALPPGPAPSPAVAAPTVPAPTVPAPTVPAPRHELPGGGSPGFLPRARQRPTLPDTVVFTAPCPACGADARWSEEREDTRLRAAVDCPCG
jgi:hypothetical protein